MAAAIEVLADAGYQAASLAAIAGRIGVSKGVISYHFAGKQELLGEVVSTVLADAAEYMRPRVLAAESHSEALRRYVSSNLEYIATHRFEILALIEIFTGTARGREADHPYAQGHRSAVQALTELLEKGQQAGEFGDFSAAHVAIALRAAIDTVSDLLRADPQVDLRAYGSELANLFERAVRA